MDRVADYDTISLPAALFLLLMALMVELAYREGEAAAKDDMMRYGRREKTRTQQAIGPRRERALHRLKTAAARRDQHHAALWEEEKHFSWLVSLLAPAAAWFALGSSFELPNRLLGVGVVSFLGTVVCLIAIHVIRREGESFVQWQGEFNIAWRDYFGRSVPSDAASQAGEADPVNKTVRQLLWAPFSGTLGVRDAFQLLFTLLLFFFLLMLEGAVAWWMAILGLIT